MGLHPQLHPPNPMQITPELAASITDVEMAFSADRLLPAWDNIPAEFKAGNVYTKIAEAMHYGSALPGGEVELKEGYSVESIQRVVLSHLQSFAPKHEHKMAGVGYLISQMCTVTSER